MAELFPSAHLGEGVRSVFGFSPGPRQPISPDDARRWSFATMTASCMWGLYEAEYDKLEDADRKDFALSKWRKFLAISEVSLRHPIDTSRYFPEMIALSWFFGFPSFNREQNMERLSRAWQFKEAKDLAGQLNLFKDSVDRDLDGVTGDDEFVAIYREIKKNVEELLSKKGN